ncbi:serpin B [Symbiobacterium terraclitae]|uniref:Serpin B n=1 Tax=Symbiobacterium terraclitae TaxID=557451 RepID=A0ABS4JN54_9FIRM|nr:serpin family protein [Symbiobacterium terraclitae]MBP2016968.1 serpin B [Symbiobacterium terraclitae]
MIIPTILRAPTALLFLGLFLAACGSTLPGPGNAGLAAPPPRPESVNPELARAADRFGVRLLRAVYAQRPGENLFLSPASAQVILTLAANGARGETQQEMLSALGYGDMALEAVNQGMRDLRGIMAHPGEKVELTTANAVWHQRGITVAPDFLSVATQQYGAQVSETTFGQPAAAEAINRWVSDQTRGRIPQLVDRTREDDRMWLVNALYFKGTWQQPFDPALTSERPFHLPGGATREIPFMHQTNGFGYLSEEGLTGVRLPYGQGDLALYLFMPDEWEGFVEGLTPERYADWIAAMGHRRIQLAVPKVKLTDRAELVEPLMAMGMQRAFVPGQADLTGLFTDSPALYISRVIQKTFLEINEEGTEAAAATGVGVTLTSAPVDPPPVVVLDRPFLLAIRDDRTGITLFLGAIVDPA